MSTIGIEPLSNMIAHKSGVKSTAAVRWDAVPFRLFGLSKPIGEGRRADSNRSTLLQLRVCGLGLLRVAEVCISRISKRIAVSFFALCCTVFFSRWCQSGVIGRSMRWLGGHGRLRLRKALFFLDGLLASLYDETCDVPR